MMVQPKSQLPLPESRNPPGKQILFVPLKAMPGGNTVPGGVGPVRVVTSPESSRQANFSRKQILFVPMKGWSP